MRLIRYTVQNLDAPCVAEKTMVDKEVWEGVVERAEDRILGMFAEISPSSETAVKPEPTV
jgi:hypothetical protein